MHDVWAFLEHIEFLSVRAMRDNFKDYTDVEYDLAVRQVAESIGFEASHKLSQV